MSSDSALDLSGDTLGGLTSQAGDRDRTRSRFQVSLQRPAPHRPVVHEERTWRLPDVEDFSDRVDPRTAVSRWQGADHDEHAFEIDGAYHILAIALRPTAFRLQLGAKTFARQKVALGAIQITPPGRMARVVHFQPCDFLHLHIPNRLLMECSEWTSGEWPADGVALRDPLLAQDPLLHKLAATLVSIADTEDQRGGLSADFLGLAIVTHLLRVYGEVGRVTAREIAALPRWRLKRVMEFIEANLDSPLALSDIAAAAGLSRMHFAAQFRAATGVRPHEYVLRRRVEKAQTLLATADVPIAELALALGFSSQAHFTVAFKRFSGMPPGRWRQSHHGDVR